MTLVETPDPEPPATGGVVTGWTVAPSSGCGIAWLRLDRKNTVPLTSAALGWTNLNFSINPEGSPA